jgi:hypothetical protein
MFMRTDDGFRSSIANQRGGVYLIAIVVTAIISGVLFYVQSHFVVKLKEIEERLIKEDIHNVKREITLAISNPKVCRANFGYNFRIDPRTVNTAYKPPQETRLGSNFLENDDISLLDSSGRAITASKFINNSNLGIRDIQLVVPGPIADLPRQMITASIFITISKLDKGIFVKDYPEFEHKVLLQLNQMGPNNYLVRDCLPEKPLEFLQPNQAPFIKKVQGDYSGFIEVGSRSSFKLCAITGFTFRPDRNTITTFRFQKGELAGPVQAQCRVIPVDDSGEILHPAIIFSPVRWKMEMQADDDMYLFKNIPIQSFKSDITCEAICF